MDEEKSRSEQTHFGSARFSDEELASVSSSFDFCFEKAPAISDGRDEPVYPIRAVPGQKELKFPEMDFRALSSVTDTQYLTHNIHKHPAIFIPQIPEYIIERFSSPRNTDGGRTTVMDPFSGSGTTGVEAKIKGRNYLGIEINPLSKLVGEVSTTPIPLSVVRATVEEISERLQSMDTSKLYSDYDPEFLDNTSKSHWFQEPARRELTAIRKVVDEFTDDFPVERYLSEFEKATLHNKQPSLKKRLTRWLVLMIANTVYEVSNADPGVSKAYKSPDMIEKIDSGEHPPDTTSTYLQNLRDSSNKLRELWQTIYPTEDAELLDSNPRHKAEVEIKLGDAREFKADNHLESVDLAITSPPYINAMNYYRGTKLRLFWIHDLLEDEVDATDLRRSIVGTNSARISDAEIDPPGTLRQKWIGSKAEYESTSLPELDGDIKAIHNGHLTEANRRAYTTWRFFAHDMLRSLTRSYEHLKPGAHFFFIIGENTISDIHIDSHRYVADIAQNLGRFDGHGGDLGEEEGFNLIGFAWDEITNRDLFQGRDHGSGVIDCEWVVILQKPED